MARQVEGPWYRAGKGTWYATLNGKGVSLGVRGEGNRHAAQLAWHRLMAGGGTTSTTAQGEGSRGEKEGKEAKEAPPEPRAGEATVKAVADAFLSAKKGAVKEATLYVYGCLLRHVTGAFGKLSADRLKAGDVVRWLYGLSVSASTRSDIAGVLASAFKWAEAEGIISGNPLKAMKRPSGESRGAKAVVTPDAHAKLCEAATPALRLLLTLLHETGARPSELAKLEARHIDFASGVAVLTDHKTAHATGKPRLIVLSAKALELFKAQAEAHPEGALLRNGRGTAWDKDAIGLAMRRASAKAGVKGIAYGYRHGFATHALASGVPDATVAALLGHSSTAMLHRHYSHLTSHAQAMREALARVRG